MRKTSVMTLTGFLAWPVMAATAQIASNAGTPSRASEPCRVNLGGSQSPFTEEALTRGINYTVSRPNIPIATPIGLGGASFADFDLDGDPDIVCVGHWGGLIAVYENDGTGHFTDRSAGVPTIPGGNGTGGGGVIAGDYDSDGDLDIFVSCYRANDVLLRNDGNFQFTDVTAAAGVAGNSGIGGGSAFGDIDGDGDLDLYVANYTDTFPYDISNRLYINQGDGTFVDQYTQLGLTQGDRPTLVGCFIDFDLDGDPDIYEGNDKGTGCVSEQNWLYENVGGTFVEITAQSGTESCTDTMAIGVGDFDRNGWPDMYCTQTDAAPGNTLLMNNGDGTFDQRNLDFGVASFALSWGATFFDHDNDCDLGIYVCNVIEPDRLYDMQGGPTAVDIGPAMGIHSDGRSYNVSTGDIDGDGDLDLLIERIPGRIELYINHEGEKRNAIALKVWGDDSNTHAIGAHVRVLAEGFWQSSQVLAGGNTYRTQNSLDQHFGLNADCVAEEIVIEWPSGGTRTLVNYPANARYEIFPLGRLGDPDGDGMISPAEIAAHVDALGPVRRGTAIFDHNGDGVIDRLDLRAAVSRLISGKPF